MKCLCVNLTDQSQRELTECELKEDMVDLSVSQSRAQVSQRREEKRRGDDASWWKWCKSPSPTGNTKLMWVTSAKTSKKQREKGHLEDRTPDLEGAMAPKHCYTWLKIKLINKAWYEIALFVIGKQLNGQRAFCFASKSPPSWGVYILKVTGSVMKCTRLTLLTTVKTV